MLAVLGGVTASADPDAPVGACTTTSSCTFNCTGGNLLTVTFDGIGQATADCGNGHAECTNLQPDICNGQSHTTTAGTGYCRIQLGGFGQATCTATTG